MRTQIEIINWVGLLFVWSDSKKFTVSWWKKISMWLILTLKWLEKWPTKDDCYKIDGRLKDGWLPVVWWWYSVGLLSFRACPFPSNYNYPHRHKTNIDRHCCYNRFCHFLSFPMRTFAQNYNFRYAWWPHMNRSHFYNTSNIDSLIRVPVWLDIYHMHYHIEHTYVDFSGIRHYNRLYRQQCIIHRHLHCVDIHCMCLMLLRIHVDFHPLFHPWIQTIYWKTPKNFETKKVWRSSQTYIFYKTIEIIEASWVENTLIGLDRRSISRAFSVRGWVTCDTFVFGMPLIAQSIRTMMTFHIGTWFTGQLLTLG